MTTLCLSFLICEMGRLMSSATQGCSKKGPQKDTWPMFSDNHCNFLTGSLLTPRAFLGDVTVSGLQFLLHTAWQADPGQRPLLASLRAALLPWEQMMWSSSQALPCASAPFSSLSYQCPPSLSLCPLLMVTLALPSFTA